MGYEWWIFSAMEITPFVVFPCILSCQSLNAVMTTMRLQRSPHTPEAPLPMNRSVNICLKLVNIFLHRSSARTSTSSAGEEDEVAWPLVDCADRTSLNPPSLTSLSTPFLIFLHSNCSR